MPIDLLDYVMPKDGWFVLLGIKNEIPKQLYAKTREEAQKRIETLLAEGRDVFFGVSKYKDDQSRKKDNVQSVKALWLDVDCGAAKVEEGKGYANQKEGLAALTKFYKDAGFPDPTLVNSGNGIHVYWVLEEELSRPEWEVFAIGLRDLCHRKGLIIDGAVFDASRVLRVPGTYNFKFGQQKPVKLVEVGEPVSIARIEEILFSGIAPQPYKKPTVPGVAFTPLPAPADGDEYITLGQTALAKQFSDSIVRSNFSKIMRRSMSGEGCMQLRDAYINRTTLSEPRWFDALSIAHYCKDRDTAIQKISDGYPGYDPAATEKKTHHIKGPHSCATFAINNPNGCKQCQHKGKIKNPLALGRELDEGQISESLKLDIPDEDIRDTSPLLNLPALPWPYVWGKDSGVWRQANGDDEDPVQVCPLYFYMVNNMHDVTVDKRIALFRIHHPLNGIKEFTLLYSDTTEPDALRKVLANHGIVEVGKASTNLFMYVNAWVKKLDAEKKVENMSTQFGWNDDYSEFIIGHHKYTKHGKMPSPVSEKTKPFADAMHAAGDINEWKDIWKYYDKQGNEGAAFAALTAFGSPLFPFLGVRGAMINIVSPNSGSGKTTVLRMINSVYGDPDFNMGQEKDTENSRYLKAGIYKHLPTCIDEVTNMASEKVSDFVYTMCNGRGKDRMVSSANALRINTTKWQSITVTTSNASLMDKIASIKASHDGEAMRVLEYNHSAYVGDNANDVHKMKVVFDSDLKVNYGMAGPLYAQYLVDNMEEVRARIAEEHRKFDEKHAISQRERMWSAAIVANLVGGVYAKKLGLIDWDLTRVYKFAVDLLNSLRKVHHIETPEGRAIAGLSGFINRYINNILTIKKESKGTTVGGIDLQTTGRELRGELLMRYETDTKMFFIAQAKFRRYCTETQIPYSEVMEYLRKCGAYVCNKKVRIAAGLNAMAPPIDCLVFNAAKADALNITDLVGIEGEQDGEAEEDGEAHDEG